MKTDDCVREPCAVSQRGQVLEERRIGGRGERLLRSEYCVLVFPSWHDLAFLRYCQRGGHDGYITVEMGR